MRVSRAVGSICLLVLLACSVPAWAGQPGEPAVQHGGEASLVLPDLAQVDFLGFSGRTLLTSGLAVCALGLLFGLVIFRQLKALPVHASMLEISELIYETCKTYLVQQGKFILLLEVFIGTIIVFYYGVFQRLDPLKVAIILIFSLIGIAGSYGVAWFGIRINTFANSRTAFAGLRGSRSHLCHS
jgi:K(+)-stimulated pyrophosphate-energized sodium pump